MFLNLNPGAVGISSLDFENLIELAAHHGFEAIDVPVAELTTEDSIVFAHALMVENNLQCGLMPLPANFFGSDEEFDLGIRRLQELGPIAREIGCTRTYDHIWPGSNERPFEVNFAWHRERLLRLCEVLGKYKVRMGIEFIGPKTLRDTFQHEFIHSLEGALELADAVGPELGIVLDSFHWYTSGGTLDEVRSLSKDRIINVHLNDARADRSRDEQQDLERAMPLETGVIDLTGFVRALKAIGYEGPVICEPFNPTREQFEKAGPEVAAATVVETMRKVLAL